MSRNSTPGQLCYEAFDAAYPADRFVRLAWDEQAPAVQRAWEAAAEAVLDTADFPTLYERWRKQQETPTGEEVPP